MSMVESSEQARVRTGPRWLLVLPLLAVVSVALVCVLALSDTDTATDREGLGRLAFGRPLNWLTQDQRNYDPSFAYRATPASPWESPTGLSLVPFLGDVLGVLVALVVVWLVVRSLTRRAKAGTA